MLPITGKSAVDFMAIPPNGPTSDDKLCADGVIMMQRFLDNR
jgi:hypothetical protein